MKIKVTLLIHLLLLSITLTMRQGTGVDAYAMACIVIWISYFATGFGVLALSVPIIIAKLRGGSQYG